MESTKLIRFNQDDKEGLIALSSIVSVLHGKDIQGLEARIAKVKNGKRDLGLIRKTAERLLHDVVSVIPFDHDTAQNYTAMFPLMRIYVGIKGDQRNHKMPHPDKDFGFTLSYDDINILLDSLSDQCMLCQKTDGQVKTCPLRRVLNKMPLGDGLSDGRYCDYQRRFGFGKNDRGRRR